MADYDVVLLVEQALSTLDARQVRSLHEGLDDPVTYHVLLPLDDAAARVEASLGSLSGSELLATRGMPMSDLDIEAVQEDCRERSTADLTATVAALEGAGATVASSALVTGSPVDELVAKVREVDGRETIILTRSHVVAELFRLDWASKARRDLDIPVLHLLEHESFDEQAAGPDGIGGA
ncbi:hypothetical protein FE634_15505 [Nocardioides dongxiaopingii]|jgi:hypothetical protein|uniref:hypothetical protein n=1 Tax=Nocardioides sp. S-1144 TaxID=2582905 RepID=UPI00110EE676|nr:hypothetical protein [Nocardioides sp. S-1144]QCW51463.1 hypothetical protein FE634_15505 [Nocardioides sp. S-1144]